MAVEQTEFAFPDEVEDKKKAGAAPAEDEVEVVDDTPPADRGQEPIEDVEPTEEELKGYTEKVQTRIKQLTKNKHDLRREKEAAERERAEALRLAQAALEENKRLKGSLNEGTKALLESTKASVEAELAAAEREVREAHEAFDSEALVKAQKKLNAAQFKAFEVERAEKSAGQVEKVEVQLNQRAPQQVADPKAVAWQRKNAWFGSNREMTSLALGLHQRLVEEEGLNPQSDEYYRRLDAGIRKRFPEEFEPEASDSVSRSKSNVVAPATRSTAPKKIVLTQTQVNLAKKLGVPLQEYAKQIAILERNSNG